MPVIGPSGRGEPRAYLQGQLSDLLVRELMGELTHRGPVIFEIQIGVGEIDVIVVWDAWRPIPHMDRSLIIRGAYARYAKNLERAFQSIDSSQKTDQIVPAVRMITGATSEEVRAHDLLPYRVEPNIQAGEVDDEDLEILMREVGAIEMPDGRLELRLPTKQLAAEIHARLMDRMPEAHWSIVENVGTVSGWLGS